MGVVVAATHLQLDQVVALKFLRPEALKNPKFVSRFEREARASVRLKSEHVARIIDVGQLETGSPYIVMEYMEGQDLAGLLEQYGSIAIPVACDFIIQACDAIAEAHSLGIVHRDLKPGNLFLASTAHGQQTLKVLDFGISKRHMSGDDLNMTSTQDVMGSPRYMSPEQMRSSKNVDGRTDIWSLGVILYELVAGQPPFYADTLTALCIKIAMEPLPGLPTLPMALPPGFDTVVRRTLEKDPARRYQSAIELAQALAPFANPESRDRAYRLVALTTRVFTSPPMPATDAVTTLNTAVGETQAKTENQNRLLKRLFAGVGISAAVAIGIGLGLMSGPGGEGGSAKDPVADPPPSPGPEATRPAKQPRGTAARATPDTTTDTKATAMSPEAPVTPPEAPATSPEARPTPDAPKPVQLDDAIELEPTPKKPIVPSKPIAPSKQQPNERDKSKDKVKPTGDSFDPFSSPD